ncbi:MAG: hypothetical protein KDI22_12555, partial [Gammaproteobacteria bacterium]|nr:hypothetical protein [Gammaproteobacteria bacterium]
PVFKLLNALKKARFPRCFAQTTHIFPTVFHSFYTQDIVVDTPKAAYILCSVWTPRSNPAACCPIAQRGPSAHNNTISGGA